MIIFHGEMRNKLPQAVTEWLRPRRTILLLAIFALIIVLVRCSEKPSEIERPKTAEEYCQRGWKSFEDGELSKALDAFNKAIELDDDYGPAYVGQGWARIGLATSSSEMQEAVVSFNQAVAHDESGADCRAGRAVANLGIGGSAGLTAALSDAQAALVIDPIFTFRHRTSFNSKDLDLIRAFCYALQASFVEALAAADQVSNSGIEQGDSGTWIVEGKAYDSYEGAVLAYLHKLSDEHSG